MNQDASSGPQDKRLRAVITEYKRRRDAGQTVDQQAFLKAYPELADGLKQFFQGEASSLDPALASTKLGKSPGPDMSVRETAHPGKVESDTASEFTARMFGRYQLLRLLGEGAMGSVFLTQDTHLDRQVALKMPRNSAADKMKDRGEFLARFTREAKAAAGLKHPNICSVYDAGEIDGTAYITMDFIDGVPLSQLVATDRLTAVSDVIRIIRVIADAVLHAHQKGIVHRDLKPGNILVDDQMNPFVTDFGLARRDSSSDGSRITQEGLLIGTPAYMAPEQVRGEQTKVGAVSDIYSLGVIFFELLTGRLPFEGSVPEMLAKVLRDPPPIPSRLHPDLTEDVDDVVWKMLLKDPGRRYQSMQDVIKAIDKLSDKLQQATSRETTTSARATTAAAQSPFEIQKSHIELMLRKGQYAGAIRDLEALAEEKSPAAKSVVEWARKTLPNAKKEAKALSPSGLAAMLKTAEQMFEKCDYQGCIQLLDDVPSLKRSEAMETLLQKAQQREAAAEELMEQIRDKERRENPEGLEAIVKKYLKLKPGNAYAKKLMQALQTYSKTPAGRRNYRFERGRLQPMPEISFFRQYALLAVLVGVLSFLATYAYVIVYLKGGSQTIAVHVDDEWLREQGGELTLVVDGDEHTISTSPSSGEPLTIVVKVGDREFSVKHGDAIVHDPRTFTIERNGRSVLQITPTDIQLRNSPLITSGPIGGSTSGQRDDASTTETTSTNGSGPWIDLFDGQDTSRWQTLGQFQVENGLLIARNGKTMAVSNDEFADFELEVEWRLSGTTPNGGIYYRELATTQYEGNEYQLIDPAHRLANTPLVRTGALYGVWPTKEGVEKPLGEWNLARIVCRGPSVEHWLNNERLFSYDTTSDAWQKALSGSSLQRGKDRIGTARKGHILLQAQTGEVAYRSIRIRRISSDGTNNSSHASANLPSPAIIPFDANQASRHQEAWAAAIKQPIEIRNSVGMRFRLIPPGEFMMGSPDDEADRREDEGPQHRVRLTKPVYMGLTEVTQQQWFDVMQSRPWEGKRYIIEGTDFPVSYVNWDDANEFCQKLGDREGIVYRLPTEAEWEFSCRAGQQTAFHFGTDAGKLSDYAWFTVNARDAGEDYAHPVARKKPNAFGLFDIQGNVAEWCLDAFSETAYTGRGDVTVDPEHKSDTDQRALRSCSWVLDTTMARSAGRGTYPRQTRTVAALGFRVVQVIADVTPDVSTASSRSDANTKSASELDLVATGVWKPLVDSSTTLPEPEKMSWKDGVLTLNKSVLPFPRINARNIVIKAEIRRVDNKSGDIQLRVTKAKSEKEAIGGYYFYSAWCWHSEKDGEHLLEIQKTGNPWQSVKGQTVELPVKKGEFVSMAFAAIDDRLMLFVDGKKLVDSHDPSFSSGSVSLASWVGIAEFRNIEYQVLDTLPASDLDKFATGTWEPLVTDKTVLSDPKKVSWKNGVLTLDHVHLPFPEVRGRNIAVRAEIRKKNSRGGGLGLRGTRSEKNEPDERGWKMYSAWYSDADAKKTNSFGLHRLGTPWKQLTTKPSERTYLSEEWVPMAFAAIEDKLMIFVDGKKLIEVEDTAFQEGFVILDSWFGLAEYRNLEYQILDPVPEPAKPSSTVDAKFGVSPYDSTLASKLQQAWSEHLKTPGEWTNSVGMKFRLIPPGEFTIGSSADEIKAAKPQLTTSYDEKRPDRADSEGPQQRITISKPFYLGLTEITQSQYQTVTGVNPSHYQRGGEGADKVGDADRSDAPVELVSWLDTGIFCDRLSSHEGFASAYHTTPDMISLTGSGGYRLPTEAEWEYACRAGTQMLYYSGNDEAGLKEVAWTAANRQAFPQPVATRKANPFGLYDMHGNAWEWVHDSWRANTYELMTGAGALDPRCDLGSPNWKVIRGGTFHYSAAEARSACRDAYPADNRWHDTGFRVAVSVDAVRQKLVKAAP